jgi:hypothetical protein
MTLFKCFGRRVHSTNYCAPHLHHGNMHFVTMHICVASQTSLFQLVSNEVAAMDATFPIADTRCNVVDEFVEWNEVTVPE